jgi:hypothetical protein
LGELWRFVAPNRRRGTISDIYLSYPERSGRALPTTWLDIFALSAAIFFGKIELNSSARHTANTV